MKKGKGDDKSRSFHYRTSKGNKQESDVFRIRATGVAYGPGSGLRARESLVVKTGNLPIGVFPPWMWKNFHMFTKSCDSEMLKWGV